MLRVGQNLKNHQEFALFGYRVISNARERIVGTTVVLSSIYSFINSIILRKQFGSMTKLKVIS